MSETMTERRTLRYGARCPHRLPDGRPCPGRLVHPAATAGPGAPLVVRPRVGVSPAAPRTFVCNGPDAHVLRDVPEAFDEGGATAAPLGGELRPW